MTSPWERGIYVHVPFCVRRCFYCDFNTYAFDEAAAAAYLDGLEKELHLIADMLQKESFSKAFDTLFIGGGTPTALSPAALSRLVTMVQDALPLKEEAEITCEANPADTVAEHFAAAREAGVNRLSLGVQSMDDDLLRSLGRTHTAAEVTDSFFTARQAGFDNINVDLIFSLPHQSMDQWQDTLTRMIDLGPEHVSCYSLIIEEGTRFGEQYAAGRLSLPGEDIEAEMFRYCIDRLQQAGYDHYEISNFARSNRRSRHNQIYWRLGEYLGLGPGAHGYWAGKRYANVRLPAEYTDALHSDRLPVAECNAVSIEEAMDDYMIFGLRMMEGVDEAEFHRRFHATPSAVYNGQIVSLERSGLLERNGSMIRLTPRGLLLGNQVFAEFLRVPQTAQL